MVLIIIASIVIVYIVVTYFLKKHYIGVEDYLTEDKKIKAFNILIPEKNFIIDGYKIELKYSGIEIHDNYFMRNVISAKAYVFVEGIEVYDWCTIKLGEIKEHSSEEFRIKNHENDIENAKILLEELNQAVIDYKTLKKAEEIVDRKQWMWYNKT